ncbi:tetraacyldisaccharide 4'-kinase [uncultured Pseudacidovorax sp.]|uniref:tetraacyldisaccharide 4'-kinase n=1 Tax=uncultured Pseudacidovorax sp. TaxID=679313 RepID=UPI0026001B2E|nr:tetraacyldisaccharide 4'-kinase [uncultured Pseudacidovorax sp.]
MHAWERRGAQAWLLRPVAALFGLLAAARRLAYARGWRRTDRLPVPVIVVGNVIAGGAGKTPVVIALVRHLQARGLPVGVISRGHGRRTRDGRAVAADSDPRDVGDEPLLIHRATGAPLVVDADRAAAGRRLLALHPEVRVIVADDGLQHLALGRDIDICVFDDRGIGNGWLLPAGPLREPWPRRCDLVLHTGERPAFAGHRGHRRLADVALDREGRKVPLASLAARDDLAAVAGIARPERFFDMLRARGLRLRTCIALPDHHDFSGWTPPPGLQLLCTEKDAAKLWPVAPTALAVPLQFDIDPAFFAALDARLSSLDGFQAA